MAEKRKIMVQAILTGVRSLADNGMGINFHTKELNPVEKATVMEFHNSHGFLLFAEDEIQEKDIPTVNSDFEGETPSKRLYNVLFVLWKQLGEKGKFPDFYTSRMEQLINAIKAKLV